MYNVESFSAPSSWEAGLNSLTISSFAGKNILHWGAWLILSAVAATIGSSQAIAQTSAATTTKTSTKPAVKKTAATSDAAASAAPVKTFGNKNAPITMEVFSDYQCPSCGSFFEQTLRPLLGPDGYVAAGKVYLVHRDFPLPMHAYSHQAARWANAAAKIGKFQDVDAVLFDNQAAWGTDGNIEKYVAQALSPTDFKRVQKLMTGCEPASTSCPSTPTSSPTRNSANQFRCKPPQPSSFSTRARNIRPLPESSPTRFSSSSSIHF